ncbi:MAG: histidine phosphatase family protein [Candidatus Muirbacterium halophilum]|nr:histidine phosphatase family protein [Candidatus Muirbacterium halophilum]MCK9476752.1 histidine phosphatase family protein [Candidatus Muirbacterium halophilum]
MKLYLVQHGVYIENENGDKVLSDNGRIETTKAALHSSEFYNIDVDKIYTSTKTRAIQTAEIIGKVLGDNIEIVIDETLSPDSNTTPWKRMIEDSNDNIMVVGHLPFLAKLLSIILVTDIDTDILTFKNSCIVCLERTKKGWIIDWVIKV